MKRESYTQVKNHAKQDRKRREAYARLDKYESLTLQEQLDSCVPDGSKKQKTRILRKMELTTEPTVVKKSTKKVKS